MGAIREARRLALGTVLIVLASAILLIEPAKTVSPTIKRIELIAYSASPITEDSIRGFKTGLAEAGLLEGRDFTLVERNAQGDMSVVRVLVQEAVQQHPALIATVSTPTLQTVVRMVTDVPVVFMTVANPMIAGAGKSMEDHLPNITGVSSLGAYADMARLVREVLPGVKRVGTLYTPSELNSEWAMDQQRAEFAAMGIELIAKPAENASEAPQAAEALMASGVEAVVQISDNLVGSCFPTIGRSASAHDVPVFAYVSEQMQQGASVGLARDYSAIGRQAAALAARVLRGEDPSTIPFEAPRLTRLLVNEENATACGLRIPEQVVQRARQQAVAGGIQK